MTGNPAVSVIIPAFNGARFIAEALESVLSQDYRPIDVVVVDDGSTDDTGAIVQRFPGVRYLWQPNRGPGSARNHGLRETTGSIVAFLDQDDLWLPGKLTAQVTRLLEDEELGFVLTLHENELEDGVRPRWMTRAQADDPGGFFPSMVVARRAVFERVGLYDETLWSASDAEWFFRAKDAGVRLDRLPRVLVRRRVHGENQTAHVSTHHAELMVAIRRSVQRQRQHGEG